MEWAERREGGGRMNREGRRGPARGREGRGVKVMTPLELEVLRITASSVPSAPE